MFYFIVGSILNGKKYDSNVSYQLKIFSTRMSHLNSIDVVLSVVAIPFFFQTSGNGLCHHPAVPIDDVKWLNTFMENIGGEPIPFENAIVKLFPFMHNPHPWVGGIIFVIIIDILLTSIKVL